MKQQIDLPSGLTSSDVMADWQREGATRLNPAERAAGCFN